MQKRLSEAMDVELKDLGDGIGKLYEDIRKSGHETVLTKVSLSKKKKSKFEGPFGAAINQFLAYVEDHEAFIYQCLAFTAGILVIIFRYFLLEPESRSMCHFTLANQQAKNLGLNYNSGWPMVITRKR